MKHPSPRNEQARFKGALRHYHRAGAQTHRTWDEWVDGKATGSVSSGNWLKIVLITVGLLALGGIIAGLVIELR